MNWPNRVLNGGLFRVGVPPRARLSTPLDSYPHPSLLNRRSGEVFSRYGEGLLPP